MTKNKEEKKEKVQVKDIDGILANINKRYGTGTIVKASSKNAQALQIARIPTNIPLLDLHLGGGIPRSRIVLVKGAESTGKSLLGLKVVKAFQQFCRICGHRWMHIDIFTGEVLEIKCKCKNPIPMKAVWLDLEGAFIQNWAIRQDIDLDHLYIIRPEYAEQSIDVIDEIIRSKECDLIVVDSVAQMTPLSEIDQSTEDWQMGLGARLMNKALRKWTSGLCAGSIMNIVGRPTIYLINQIRMKIGIAYGNPETIPGGLGQAFYNSITIQLTSKSMIEQNIKIDPESKPKKEIVGKVIEYKITKNKTATPHKTATLNLYFSDCDGYIAGDIDIGLQWINLGRLYGYITRKGAWYYINDDVLAQGREKAAIEILKNYDFCKYMWEEICNQELGFIP